MTRRPIFRRTGPWTRIPGSSPRRWRRAWQRIPQPFLASRYLHGNIVPVRKVAAEHRAAYRATLLAAAKAAQACGEKWRVNSSYRHRAEQEALYAKYLNGTGNLAARPGTSDHERGLALDMSDPDGSPVGSSTKRRNALQARGMVIDVPGELWHARRVGSA